METKILAVSIVALAGFTLRGAIRNHQNEKLIGKLWEVNDLLAFKLDDSGIPMTDAMRNSIHHILKK